MALNLEAMGKPIGPVSKDYTWKDVVLYALGVGSGSSELEYCYEKQLKVLVLEGSLVPILSSSSLAIDSRLPLNRRYLRPWALQMLLCMSLDFTTRFGQPLTLTSAVRTMQTQRRLLRWNRNAAPIHGDTSSSHLTGATFDISRKNMTPAENEWMRAALLAYTVQGRVIYLEETVQPCYHVFVMPPKELP